MSKSQPNSYTAAADADDGDHGRGKDVSVSVFVRLKLDVLFLARRLGPEYISVERVGKFAAVLSRNRFQDDKQNQLVRKNAHRGSPATEGARCLV